MLTAHHTGWMNSYIYDHSNGRFAPMLQRRWTLIFPVGLDFTFERIWNGITFMKLNPFREYSFKHLTPIVTLELGLIPVQFNGRIIDKDKLSVIIARLAGSKYYADVLCSTISCICTIEYMNSSYPRLNLK